MGGMGAAKRDEDQNPFSQGTEGKALKSLRDRFASKGAAPKVETPKAPPPKAETPKAPPAKAEAPKAAPPKPEATKTPAKKP